HQLRVGVPVRVQDQLVAGADAGGDIDLPPHVLAVDDGIQQPSVHGLVQLLLVVQHEVGRRVVEEAADAQEHILRVGGAGVGAGLVAPQHKPALGAHPGSDAVFVQVVAMILGDQFLGAVRQAGGSDGRGHIGRAGVGNVAVLGIVVDSNSGSHRAAAVYHVAHLAVGPQAVSIPA